MIHFIIRSVDTLKLPESLATEKTESEAPLLECLYLSLLITV